MNQKEKDELFKEFIDLYKQHYMDSPDKNHIELFYDFLDSKGLLKENDNS